MANYTITVTTYYENGFGSLTFGPDIQLQRGDTVTIDYSTATGNSATVTCSGFTNTVFTNNSTMYLSPGQTETRTVRSDATFGIVTLSASSSVGSTGYVDVEVVSGIDDTPDSFSLGPNITSANPGETIYAPKINVSGINTQVTASVTGNAQVSHSGSNQWSSSITVSSGDTIYIRMTASSAYSTSVSTTLSIGTGSDYWSITTKTDPGSGEVINFPKTTTPISLTDVIDFYGGDGVSSTQRNMRAYLKGDGLVPNISQNSAIPTSGELRLTDFLGSATSLYLEKEPQSGVFFGDTTQGETSGTINWYFGGSQSRDPKLGFGNMIETVEIKWILNDPTGQVSMDVSETYSTLHRGMTLSASAPSNSENLYQGTVDCYIRSTYDPTKEITFTVNFSFSFYGP